MTDCVRYKYGCTCGPCHERYIKAHAHPCTYGVDPRLQDGKLYARGYPVPLGVVDEVHHHPDGPVWYGDNVA